MTMMSESSDEVVRIERETVAACMTCPLCEELFIDATTIPECLHTFCRKCIYEKIADEELNCCPICNTELGCAPLDKLRPDHNLQDLRTKIFPPKRRNLEVPEAVPFVLEDTHSVSTPGRRKERSLSSLVIKTPEESVKTIMTGSRSKSIGKKNSASVVPVEEEPVKNQENLLYQNLSDSKEFEAQALTNIVKGHGIKSKVNGNEASASGSVKTGKSQGARQKRVAISEDLNVPAQPADADHNDGICTPVWFSLIATDDLERDHAPLPQIPSRFLRVKDGSLAVSTIKKYVVQKLGLSTEAEVEIFLYGQPLDPSLQIRELVQWWLEIAAPPPSQPIRTAIGSSAKDFMMVLSYARKRHPP